MRILGAIVEPTTGLLAIGVADLFHRRGIRAKPVGDDARDVDAVVSCAGNAAFKPFADLTDADYELGLRSKLMGQVSLARAAKDHLRDGGSITPTTGVPATRPMPGSALFSLVNAGPLPGVGDRGAAGQSSDTAVRFHSPSPSIH
jgi:NADP-dependent 3-hydroxy acid dehydrogenase YdfG